MNRLTITIIFLIFASLLSSTTIAETISQAESDAMRILMLEKALAPQTPLGLASMFAKANKDRNGAVQFMLFSNQLKNEYKNNWPYWVSGTSSPWILSFTIKKIAQNKDSWQFKITYQWATADGPFKPDLIQVIVVEPTPKASNSSQQWWISKFEEN